MSRVKSPQEKKRNAYERDHYNGGRHTKYNGVSTLKIKFERGFRKQANDIASRWAADDGDSDNTLPQGAARRLGALRRKSTDPNGGYSLRDFVRTRRVRNGLNFGEKQTRRRMCQEASVAKTRKDESQ